MNFGWFTEATPDAEFSRTVVHEFGHALGCKHEHQNPEGGIQWDIPKVYAAYSGAPNYWSTAKIGAQVIQTYSANITQFTQMDPTSIMMYSVEPSLTLNGFKAGMNRYLSDVDKEFIAAKYPQSKELDIQVTRDLIVVADDVGLGTSGMRVYVPNLPPGYYYVGQYVQNDSAAPRCSAIIVKDKSADQSALKPPIGATMIWSDAGSGKTDKCSVWRPTGPAGYIALGDVFKRGTDYLPPKLDNYRCVRASLTSQAVCLTAAIWSSDGSRVDRQRDIVQNRAAVDDGQMHSRKSISGLPSPEGAGHHVGDGVLYRGRLQESISTPHNT